LAYEPVKATDSAVSSACSRFSAVARRKHLFRMPAQFLTASRVLGVDPPLARKVA
jgi:hypothetical protein